MNRRTYGQLCGLARSLDVLGERWTLLLVRELLMGPKRFGQVQAVMPGLGPTLLAKRLRELTEHGIAELVELPPPAAVNAYRLTQAGEGLRPAVEAFATWGFALIDDPLAEANDTTRASLLAFTAAAGSKTDGATTTTAQFDVDGDRFGVRLGEGRAWVTHGVIDEPAVAVTGTLLELWAALHDDAEFEDVVGDRSALDAVLSAMALPGRA